MRDDDNMAWWDADREQDSREFNDYRNSYGGREDELTWEDIDALAEQHRKQKEADKNG